MSDVHRDNPEATPEQIENIQKAQLLGIGQYARAPENLTDNVTRQCWDCGQEFAVTAANADKTSKWFRMCGYCLADQL